MTVSPIQTPFMVSSPGKVIIFGEHASVYGKPAIAAALSLRSYLMVTKSDDPNTVNLRFPDIDFQKSWRVEEFPWQAAKKRQILKTQQDVSNDSIVNSESDGDSSQNGKALSNQSLEELIPDLVSALTSMLIGVDSIQYSAAYAFLYLYINLCDQNVPGYTFTVRSTLPVGAGLGSSASLGVCLAAAISLIGGHINKPTLKFDDLVKNESPDSQFINNWSFLAEKCIHGNPSGIDNTVSCFGGAVMFQRMKSSVPSVRTSMRNFPSFKLLLTNTKQPRKTADLVSKVAVLINEFPKSSNAILDAIDHLTKEGYKLMIKPFFDPEAKQRFRELIRMNHGLLVSLGVSHPTLERVKVCCDELDVGDTKLTGAGGGGCAITLLKDDLSEKVIAEAKNALKLGGFETFETSLGGKGVAFSTPSPNFTKEDLLTFKGRNEIESAIGVDSNPSIWTFW